MKSIVAAVVGMLAFAGAAHAQGVNAPENTGYIAFVAQSAFGNVTSQSFGVEGGVALNPRLDIIAELGVVRDTTPDTLGPTAQQIASYLAQTQSGVGYSVKQPIGFGAVGARYAIPYSERISPYVLGLVGLGRVKKDVTFTVDGADVTDKLDTYGVVLGRDLAGTESKPMVTVGVGAMWQASPALVLDLGYRYSRVATEVTGTNVNRIGIGIGYRF
jgi:opacity protein-like surface antigen